MTKLCGTFLQRISGQRTQSLYNEDMTTTPNTEHEIVGKTSYAYTEGDRRVRVLITAVDEQLSGPTGWAVWGIRLMKRSRAAMPENPQPRRYFIPRRES